MEAIAELIAALVGALVHALVALLEAFATLLAIVAEFVFLALTQGLSAASKKYKQRKQERESRLEAMHDAKGGRVQAVETQPLIGLKHSAIIGSIVLVAIVCAVAAWAIRDRIRKEQVATTRLQVAKLADSFSQQIKEQQIADPKPGLLPDRDAWEQPIELFVDKALLGSLVVVRSSGPDRKSGSIDDILATRVIRSPAKQVGGELVDRGVKAIRDRVSRVLPGADKEMLPEDMDIGQQ
ncbi:MAG TPA: hypothetical protein VMM76_05230 [Pirellulaceae bacterium]|nr:hypothetical protein [Pirellulaceae bacterium]